MRMNKEHKGKFFVPMYDIDLVWHTHQHMATSYKRDTEAYFGENTKLYLPPANDVWGKVMFLHLSVSHSVYRGMVYTPRQTPPTLGRPPQADNPRMATDVGGMHPTEMHSCC